MFSLAGRLLEKGFDLANVIFAPFLYGEVVTRILIDFLRFLIVSGWNDLGSKRVFFDLF